MNPCPGTVLGRTAGKKEFSWPQPAFFLTEPEVRSPRHAVPNSEFGRSTMSPVLI